MFSFDRVRGRLAALLAVAVAATTIAATAPAAWAVDDVAPRLDAITFTSPSDVAPGDPVTISYSATAASPSISIVATFDDGAGRRTYWDFGGELPLNGTASTTVPDGLVNAVTRLAMVTVTDASGNRTRYWANDMSCEPACPGAAHDLSFDVSLSVSGSTPDTQVPLLTSVSVATPNVPVGQVARLDLGVDEAHLPVTSVGPVPAAVFTNGHETFRLTGPPTEYGFITGVVPATVPNGAYWLDAVYLGDQPGNLSAYLASGAVRLRPQGSAVGPATHKLPFKDTTIVVTGSSVDGESPVLSSVAYADGHFASGATGTVRYAVTEQALDTVTFRFEMSNVSQSPTYWTWEGKVSGADVASGPVPVVSTGTWRVDTIVLRDKSGNYSTYGRDGTLRCNRPCPATHGIDFAALDLDVIAKPTAPSRVDVTPLNGSARVQWMVPSDPGNTVTTGYTLTVSPGSRTFSLGAGAQGLTVTGLANNTAYTFSVRARNAAGLGPAATAKGIPRPQQRLFLTVDVSNDGRADIIGVTRGNVAYIYRGNGVGGISGSTRVGSSLGDIRTLLPALARPNDDFFGGNVLSVSYSGYDEAWWAYNGNRLVAFNSIFVSKFNAYRQIVTPGDFNGNAKADVLTIADNGDLYLWVNKDWAHFYAPRKIGGGWQSFTSVVGVGDFDGDRRGDLVARKADGTLWLYPGNGAGGFRPRKQIGTSWNGFSQIAGMGDFTGDHRNDLLALAPNGYLYVYKGNGKGGFSGRILVSKGFSSYV